MKRDDFWDPFLYLMLAAIVGVPILTSVSEKAAAFLVNTHVLTDTDVLIPIANGAGLDLGRTVIAAAVVVLLLLGLIWVVQRRRSGNNEEVKK